MTPPGLVAPGGRYPKNLRPIAERAAAKPVAPPRWKKMVGDFFPGGMDGAAINAAGIAPLQPEHDRRKAIKTPAEVLTAPARLQSFGVGFPCGSSPISSRPSARWRCWVRAASASPRAATILTTTKNP
jgi:predicted metalloendopeptidase